MEQSILLAKLEALPSTSRFVEEQLLGAVPWIFGADGEAFSDWRREVAKAARIDQGAVYLVGSAATGYSLSPKKPGREFVPVGGGHRPSDIDIAVVDPALFERTWNTIVSYDRKRSLLRALGEGGGQYEFRDRLGRIRLQVYWGTIASSHTLPGTPEAQRLRSLFAATTRRAPFQGHVVRARVYRRRRDLVAYHMQSLEQLIESLRK
jgi:hypothetical protein